VRAPDITYRYIYPIDVAGPTFEVIARTLNAADTATLVSNNLRGIPMNKVLVLTNVTCFTNPGATQGVTAITVSMFTSAGAQINVASEQFVVVADQNQALNWQGEVYIPGRGEGNSSVGFSAQYDAAVNSNSAVFHLQGVVIPRGNVATF